MSRSTSPSRARRLRVALLVLSLVVLVGIAPVWGSMFGEEDTTLIHMLVQLLQIQDDMTQLNKIAKEAAGTANTLLSAYQEVNAGINTIKSYSFDAFLNDLRVDLYKQYPGFAQLQNATQKLTHWNDSFTTSPFTAYQAIGAVVGDASAPLRKDVAAGKQSLDEEILLRGEAAGGLAAAYTAEQATEAFDTQVKSMASLASSASPGQAAQISARAGLMVAAQQSYVMRLLARVVRLHTVDSTLEYSRRMQARNSAYDQRDTTLAFAKATLAPPALINFTSADGTASTSDSAVQPAVQP